MTAPRAHPAPLTEPSVSAQPHPASRFQPTTINVLQAGRGLAALAVVAHHATLAAPLTSGPVPARPLWFHGYLGVDFFFVLSGFIIAFSMINRTQWPRAYFSARFRRIFIPYLPVGVGVALIYAAVPSMSMANRGWSWLTTFTLLPIPMPPALSVAWTLQHELLFYVVFGAAWFTRTLRYVLPIWIAAIVAVHLAGFVHLLVFKLINLEFIMGVSIAFLMSRGRAIERMWLFAPVCFGAWFALGCPRTYSILVGAGIACLLPVLIRAEREGRLRVPRWLVLVGAASYSIYLVHNPLISLAVRVLPPLGGVAFLVLGLCGTAGGFAYFYLWERPLIARQHRRLSRIPVPSVQ